MTLASVLDVMRAANRFSHRKLFDWELLSLDGRSPILTCGLPVPADKTLQKELGGDLLMLIGGFNQDHYVDKQKLNLLRAVIPRFKVVGGIEAGSWLLARMGKLNGRKATTHWEDLEEFSLRFPAIEVRSDRYVIDGNVFTSGGASPSFDFMLHLIRQRFGYHLALEVASAFIYDGVHTATDSQPYVSLGNLETYEPRVAQAIRLMETHIEDTLPIVDIARQLQISTRTLELLFSETLQSSPGKYYLRMRLQTARRLVQDTRLTMQEIAVRTGFSSTASLSRQFSKHYKVSPSQHRKLRGSATA